MSLDLGVILGAFGYGFPGTGSYPGMDEQKRRFHRLFRTGTFVFGLTAIFHVSETAAAQRVWGNAETLLLGPAAAVPLRSEPTPAPLNPATNSRIRTGAEASLAVPMGIRELAIHRIATRFGLGATPVSVMIGRIGFDRLEQHRISLGASRPVKASDVSDEAQITVGVRGTLDGFSSPGRPIALEPAVSAGSLLRLSESLDAGMVTTLRGADAHASRAIDVQAAVSIRVGRWARTGFGWMHSTARRPEVATAVLLETGWGASLMAGIGGGASNAGVSCAIRTGGVRIEMAWMRTGAAGAARFVSAGLFRKTGSPDGY